MHCSNLWIHSPKETNSFLDSDPIYGCVKAEKCQNKCEDVGTRVIYILNERLLWFFLFLEQTIFRLTTHTEKVMSSVQARLHVSWFCGWRLWSISGQISSLYSRCRCRWPPAQRTLQTCSSAPAPRLFCLPSPPFSASYFIYVLVFLFLPSVTATSLLLSLELPSFLSSQYFWHHTDDNE